MDNNYILSDTVNILHSVYKDMAEELDFSEPSHISVFTKTAQTLGSLACQLEALQLNRLKLIKQKKLELGHVLDKHQFYYNEATEEEREEARAKCEILNNSIETIEDAFLVDHEE